MSAVQKMSDIANRSTLAANTSELIDQARARLVEAAGNSGNSDRQVRSQPQRSADILSIIGYSAMSIYALAIIVRLTGIY